MLSPRAMRLIQQLASPLQTKQAVHVEDGGPLSQYVAGTIGRAAGLPGLLVSPRAMRSPTAAKERRQPHREIAELMERNAPQLRDTVLRLGGTDIVDDMIWKRERGESLPWYRRVGGRLAHNPKTSILEKLLGVVDTPWTNLVTTLTRRPHYNPATDVAVNFMDDLVVTAHELGHAIDFADGVDLPGRRHLSGLPRKALYDVYQELIREARKTQKARKAQK